MEVFFVFVVWLGAAIACGVWADSRGRSGFGWFFFSVLLSPLIGLILVAVLTDLKAKQVEEDLRRQDQRREHERQLESLRAVTTTATVAAKGSITDELTKLAALKQQGILTEEEFQSQKAKLLGA